ncbi:hypothetical protein GRI43_11410 [Altererythrobacter luteolus]|uniref:Uncharacterized protein n=1 Tax=Pontixanthobacter luteolus TaxID=295089 RepID=A0A6I4V802_9SPHN|nr:hypothetical protein [Pontixanthobacter luteolus]MXP47992.1 hypothetical protein [Pontixanthobacter luteolus]
MSALAFIAALASSAPFASATLPLPPELRESASIVSLDSEGNVTALRSGDGKMVCIADRPDDVTFDVRCYHRDFIPYLYRVRRLSAEGISRADIDARIEQEMEAGTFHMTMRPTAGYRMLGPITALTEDGTAWTDEMWRWQSIHIPNATAEDLGFVTEEDLGLVTGDEALMPYVMASGDLWSHVMINSPPE